MPGDIAPDLFPNAWLVPAVCAQRDQMEEAQPSQTSGPLFSHIPHLFQKGFETIKPDILKN